MRRSRCGSLLNLACLVGLGCLGASQSFADTQTFTLTGVSGLSLAGVYTSPYLGGIGAVDLTSNPKLPDMNVICDDFGDNSYLPEQWQVNQTMLADIESESSTSTILKWAGADSQGTVDGQAGWTLDQKTAYNAAAYLTIEILNANAATLNDPSNQTKQTTQEDLSFALWELFAPNAGTGQTTTHTPTPGNANWASAAHAGDNVVGWLTNGHGDPNAATDLTAATNDVEAAIAAVKAPSFHGFTGTVTIYSYAVGSTPPPQCGSSLDTPCTDTPPQEFISVSGGTQIRVPEGSSFDSIGVYLIGGALALLFFGRRRFLRIQ